MQNQKQPQIVILNLKNITVVIGRVTSHTFNVHKHNSPKHSQYKTLTNSKDQCYFAPMVGIIFRIIN
jgi:hypothetical protein